MDRHRTLGLSLAVGGFVLFASLVIAGSIRTPIAAVSGTSPLEYAAIGTSFALVMIGIVLVMSSGLPE
ncbi:hypothetical protein [Halovivax cerinus]|uniref:Uncharacterized protein n=1 Tax=Halovivax cerinus TaxID=1487865 RepID=A0ABD5NM98_9EURY|nr:hypothetical protein [Halovivax cerinus]